MEPPAGHARVSDAAGLPQDPPRICVSDKVPGDAHAAGPTRLGSTMGSDVTCRHSALSDVHPDWVRAAIPGGQDLFFSCQKYCSDGI